ncbi:MAG: GH32 C-terminal domain-containing protein, partial [Eubacteriales bacterium]|nr:GH32 C-terminal domain-containing protein [Eubacteriales bacterium]
DVNQTEAKIKEYFNDNTMPANPKARPYYEIPNNVEPLIAIATDKEASGVLMLEFDVAMQRVSLVNLPMDTDPFWRQSCQAVPPATDPGPDGVRVAEKTFAIENGKAIDIKIAVDHDMVEVFVGEQVALNYRIYAKPEFEIGLIAQDAKVEFSQITLTTV